MGVFYNPMTVVLNRDVVETINAHFKAKFSRQNRDNIALEATQRSGHL
jgi:hypothetical protein